METEAALQEILNGNFKTGWAMFNRVRTNRTLSREELENARGALAQAVINSEAHIAQLRAVQYQNKHILEELKLQTEMRLALHALEITSTQTTQHLIKDAGRRGVTLENDQTMKLRQHETEQLRQINKHELASRLIEAKVRSVLSMEEEQRRAEIRMAERQMYSELEVEMEFRKAMNTLAVITKFKHLHFNAFDEVRSRINNLLEEGHRIEMSELPIHVKGAQLRVLQEAIVAYEEIFHAQKTRLMGTRYGEEVEGIGGLNSNYGGDSDEGGQTAYKQLPAEDTWEGPLW